MRRDPDRDAGQHKREPHTHCKYDERVFTVMARQEGVIPLIEQIDDGAHHANRESDKTRNP